jgi:hypothetical protein
VVLGRVLFVQDLRSTGEESSEFVARWARHDPAQHSRPDLILQPAGLDLSRSTCDVGGWV